MIVLLKHIIRDRPSLFFHLLIKGLLSLLFPTPLIVENWIVNCSTGVWNTTISTCYNWYAWEKGNATCTIYTTFAGKGRGTLDFGNCWKRGVVKVYLNRSEIASARPGENKLISFDFDGESKLEIHELNTAIIQINKFGLSDSHKGVELKLTDQVYCLT